MNPEERKGSPEPKPRYVWDPKKLAWVETTEPEIQEPVTEKAAEPRREQVLEEAAVEAKAEEVPGEALVEGAPAEAIAEVGGLQYKGAAIRLLAFIVDCIILLIIFYLFNLVSGSRLLVNAVSEEVFNSLTWHQWALLGILGVYFVSFWAWRGQTPGKMLLGVKIVKSDGSRIGIVRVLVRFIVYFFYLLLWGFAGSRIPVLVLFFIVILIIIAVNKRKRGIHDFIAGTVVINSRAPTPQLVEAEVVDVAEAIEETAKPPVAIEPETDKTDQDK